MVAAIELFGIAAAGTQKILWTKIYFGLAAVAGILTASAELIRVIAHFVAKKDLIEDCRGELTGAKAETLSGTIANIDRPEAERLCDDDWQRGIWWDLGWLVLTSSLALVFTGLVGAYYHQLLDPSFSRTRSTATPNQPVPQPSTSGGFALQAYPVGASYQVAQHSPFSPPNYNPPPDYLPPEHLNQMKAEKK